MSDLPQRPKFYLHRSRRFWGGLSVLLLLIGWWATSIWTVSWVNYKKEYWFSDGLSSGGYEPEGMDSFRTHFYGLSQKEGCVVLSFGNNDEPSAPGRSMPGFWVGSLEVIDQSSMDQIRFCPIWDPSLSDDPYDFASLYLPIWPLIALWSILWPLWIRSGNKLEEKRFLNPPQAHHP